MDGAVLLVLGNAPALKVSAWKQHSVLSTPGGANKTRIIIIA